MSTTKKPTSASAEKAMKLSAEQLMLLAKQAGISNEQLAALKADMSPEDLVAYLLEKKKEIDAQLAQQDNDEIVVSEDDSTDEVDEKSIFDTEDMQSAEEALAENEAQSAQASQDTTQANAADSGLNSGDELVDGSLEAIPMNSDYSALLPSSAAGQQASSGHSFEPWQIGLGVVGLGVGVAALSGGGGGGGHHDGGSNAGTDTGTTVNGQVGMGVFSDGATVTAYAKDGTTVLGTAEVSNGRFSITLKDGYTGPVLLKLVDSNGAATNYNNETTDQQTDLGAVVLMSVNVVASGNNVINMTEASTLLTNKVYEMLGADNAELTQEAIDDVAQAFVDELGFNPLTTAVVTVDSDEWNVDTMTSAETEYGQFLALLSGMSSQDTNGVASVLQLLDDNMTVSENGDKFDITWNDANLAQALLAGGLAYDASENGQNDGAGSVATDLAKKLLNIDTSSETGVYLQGVVRGGSNAAEINNAAGNEVTFIVSFSGEVEGFNKDNFDAVVTITSGISNTFEIIDLGDGQYKVVVTLEGDYVSGSVSLTVDKNAITDTAQQALVDTPDALAGIEQGFTIDIIKNRSADDFAELSTAQIGALSNAQIAALTTDQIAAEVAGGSTVIGLLADAKVALLDANELTALGTELVQGLVTGQVASLTKAQLEATSKDADDKDVSLLAKLSAEQISDLSTGVVGTLSGATLAALDAELVHGLTSAQIEVLTTGQLSTKSGVYLISKLSTEQVASLTADQFKLSAAVIQSMTGEQVNALSLAQLEYTTGSSSSSATVYERLTDEQKESLPQATVTNFSDDTGVSNGDFDTSVASQTVTGTYKNLGEGRTIEVRASDADDWVEVTLGDNGTWTANLTLVEGDGTQIQIRVKQGDETLEIAQHDYRLDTTAPDAPIVTTENETINTNTTTASVTFDVNDANVGFVIAISVNGQVVDTHTLTATEISAGKYVATLTDLADDENTVTATIKDLAGNVSESSDTVTVTVDTTAPTIDFNNTSPADEGFVAESGSITIAFDEKMALASGTITLVDDTDSANTQTIDIPSNNVVLSEDGLSIIITPPSALVKDHQYHVTVSAGAVTDTAGNDFAGLTDDTALNFTVSSLNIEIGDIAEDNIINAEEAQGDISFELTVSGDSNTLDALTAEDFSVSYAGQLTSNDFTIEKQGGVWVVTLASAYVAGLEDVESADLVVTVTTTVDGSEVSASASKSVMVDTIAPEAPTITVDELVNQTTVSVAITAATAVIGDTIEIVKGSETLGTLEITDQNFSQSGNYSIDITLTEGSTDIEAFVYDKAGNIGSKSQSATVEVDTTVPTVSDSNPANNDTIASTGNLSFTFNEAMVLGQSGTITLVNADDDSDTITINITDSNQVTLSQDGLTLTVNPTNNLTLGATYTASISAGALTDKAGNNFAGTDLSFSVANLSISIDTIAQDNIINASEAGSVTISGKVSGDQALLDSLTAQDFLITTSNGYNNDAASYSSVDGTWSYTYDFNADEDSEDIEVSVMVTTTVGGEQVDASADSTFTLDTTAPDAVTSATIDDSVTVDSTTVTNDTTPAVTVDLTNTGANDGDTLKLYRDGNSIATLVLTQAMIDANAATITSDTALSADGSYTFTTTITDVAGNESAVSSDLTFELDTTAPTYSSTTDIAAATGAFTIDFSEDISLADESLIQLLDGSGNAITLQSGDITVTDSTLTISSDSIVSGSDYSVSIGAGALTDKVGNEVTASTTDEVTVVGAPSLMASQALKGITNLDVQSDLVLTYDQDISLKDGTLTLKADSQTGWTINNTIADPVQTGTADSTGDIVLTIAGGVVTGMTVGGRDNQGGVAFNLDGAITIDGSKLTINLDSTGYDLDFASQYHVEMTEGLIASSTDETLVSEALTDASLTQFTTVTPAANTSGNDSVKFGADGSVEDSFIWISAQQSDTTNSAIELNFSDDEYAIVQQSLGNSVTNIDYDGHINITGFTGNDLYYQDNFGNLDIVPTTEADTNSTDAAWGAPNEYTRKLDAAVNGTGLELNFVDFPDNPGWNGIDAQIDGDAFVEQMLGAQNFVFG